MKNKPTLSIAPYYGGKGRMAHFIADRINYDDTDVFITPFGGMCRVLLNKPRHREEFYNDFSAGLNALMRVLSSPEQAVEFIHRLEDETDYSLATFERQKEIFDSAEKDFEEQARARLRNAFIAHGLATPFSINTLFDTITNELCKVVPEDGEGFLSDSDFPEYLLRGTPDTLGSLKELFSTIKKHPDYQESLEQPLIDWLRFYIIKQEGELRRPMDYGKPISDIELAMATYVVFQQSRDGMGQVWSSAKFSSDAQYKKQLVKLFDCAERLEGVHVLELDASDFFVKLINWNDEEKKHEYIRPFEKFNTPEVMMYCDPSYISVESEAKLLSGINVGQVPSLSEAIFKKYGGKMPANLGKVYARSFGYQQQEQFLRGIQNARAHIMVSNYDLQLYNKYLNPSTGWKREEFETTTGVGGKRNNKRTEVIWYNY